jgi:hypothetical protein
MVRPPATLTTWPVMNAASSEARKVTMPDVGRLADALHRDGAHQRVVDLAPGLALAEEAAQDRRVGGPGQRATTQEVVPSTGLNTPFGVAVDTAGAVYVVKPEQSRAETASALRATLTPTSSRSWSRPAGRVRSPSEPLFIV